MWDTAQWCRPMTTFPRVPETPDAPAMAAVPALLWAHRGYRLLVAHNEVGTLSRAWCVRLVRSSPHASLTRKIHP